MRAIHASTVLHPSDANQTAKLIGAIGRPRRHRRSSAPCAARPPSARRRTRTSAIGGTASPATATTSRSSPSASRVDEAVKAAERLAWRGHQGPRARRLLDQADRRRRPSAPPPATAARSSPSRTTPRGRPRRRRPRGPRRGRRPPPRRQARRPRDPGSGTPEELLHAAGSTPTRSPTPRRSSSPPQRAQAARSVSSLRRHAPGGEGDDRAPRATSRSSQPPGLRTASGGSPDAQRR